MFGQLDTSALESQYSPDGQHAYHPKQMISILIYGYTHGVFSMRELEKRCHEDLSFMYIAKMNCPNFRTLNNFRKDNSEFFEDSFVQTVQLAIELNMASLGHISFDGSKFKANSSKHKAMSYGRLKEKEQKLCKEIAKLIKQGNDCNDEDRDYQDKSSYELPDELAFKEHRLETIQNAKKALEESHLILVRKLMIRNKSALQIMKLALWGRMAVLIIVITLKSVLIETFKSLSASM